MGGGGSKSKSPQKTVKKEVVVEEPPKAAPASPAPAPEPVKVESPPPKKESIKPEPVKVESPPPKKESIKPEPVKVESPPPKKESIKPEKKESVVVASPKKESIKPEKKESVIAASPKKESIKPTSDVAADAVAAEQQEEESQVTVEEDSHRHPIVVDTGSYLTKAGLADNFTEPTTIMSTVVGRPRNVEKVDGWLGQKNLYVGNDAEILEDNLTLKWPMDKGQVALSNWEDMEKVWHAVFYSKLRIKPSEHPIIMCEAPLTPKASRERMAKIMFNNFKVPALYVGNSAVFALFASGRKTGCVLELGDSIGHVVPVVGEHIIPSAIQEISICGRDLTEFMHRMLSDRGIHFENHKNAMDVSRELKERFGYIAKDYDKEFEVAQDEEHEKTYELSDGTQFSVGIERFKVAQPLFTPSLIYEHLEQGGVHVSLHAAITACEASIQGNMYGNILLSGGTTMFAGFADKLKEELTKLSPEATINIVRPPNRKYSAWIGAAMFGSEPLVKLLDKVVTHDEFLEQGVASLNKFD